jgi:FAD/FMN-containing dehydrogenase
VVGFARARGLQVAPQGTGHAAAPLGSLEDTILLKTSRMRGVEIDPVTQRARAEAGALWGDVTGQAAEHGLAALAGSAADVGVVGYTLGGGIGWLARKHGLAANSVAAVEIVTADGWLVRADAENQADLFWAIRGGGGSFGIVTAIEFALYPIAEVYAGALFFPWERSAEVLQAWRDWTETVPDEVTSLGRILQFPPIPDIPEHLRGRSFVVVEATYAGGEVEGAALVQPLRQLGPEIDTFGMIPATALQELHMDPPHPVPGVGDGMLLADADPEAIDALVATTGPGSGSPFVSVEVRHLAGALAKSSPSHGALSSLDADYALFAVGIPMSSDVATAIEATLQSMRQTLAPWDAGVKYMNFTETPTGGGGLHAQHAYHRLRRIKAQYDPKNVIRSNHPV